MASLLLRAPGGSLIGEVTPDLSAFIEAWVDGPRPASRDVDPAVRDLVRQTQMRAFEVIADWDDIEESELDPPVLDRLPDIRVPTLILLGALYLDAIRSSP